MCFEFVRCEDESAAVAANEGKTIVVFRNSHFAVLQVRRGDICIKRVHLGNTVAAETQQVV